MAASWTDPNLMPLLELTSNQFRWTARHRRFAAEASALGCPESWWLQQLFADDLLARGFAMRSSRTGDVKRFLLIKTDAKAWVFESIGDDSPFYCVIYDDRAKSVNPNPASLRR